MNPGLFPRQPKSKAEIERMLVDLYRQHSPSPVPYEARIKLYDSPRPDGCNWWLAESRFSPRPEDLHEAHAADRLWDSFVLIEAERFLQAFYNVE